MAPAQPVGSRLPARKFAMVFTFQPGKRCRDSHQSPSLSQRAPRTRTGSPTGLVGSSPAGAARATGPLDLAGCVSVEHLEQQCIPLPSPVGFL